MKKSLKLKVDPRAASMHEVEQDLAYSAARSDIECECIGVDLPNGNWWDTTQFQPESEGVFDPGALPTMIARAVAYLEWRGLLERMWGSPHIVHIKDAP